jgi:sulfite exporter TauE/SafE
MDGAAPRLGGWLWAERGNILALFGLLATVGFGLLACLFFYMPYLEGQLRNNPTYRHLKAKQLAHPRVIGLYRGWLVSTLDALDRWMGRPGDWRCGFD